MNQRVALVMVENNVKGKDRHYNQTNGFSGISKQAVINTYGEELWPYFKFFAEHENPVKYSDMVYDHVARGIWPDYYGELIDNACEAEVPVNKEMLINMPAQVDNPENTAIIALLLDADTGAIISADEVEAEEYNKLLNNVAQVDANSLDFAYEAGLLRIASSSAGRVSITSVDGIELLTSTLKEGMNEIDMSGLNGIFIVRAITNAGTVKTIKYAL